APMRADAEITSEQAQREHALLTQVLASFGACADTRLKQLMEAPTRHLHTFLREVRLTKMNGGGPPSPSPRLVISPTDTVRSSSCCRTSSEPLCKQSRLTMKHTKM